MNGDKKGENNMHAKLTTELVKTLRKEYFDNDHTFLSLSYKYGLNKQTIRNAVRGISWNHVKYYLDKNKTARNEKRYRNNGNRKQPTE